jgi:hypothetical protein
LQALFDFSKNPLPVFDHPLPQAGEGDIEGTPSRERGIMNKKCQVVILALEVLLGIRN